MAGKVRLCRPRKVISCSGTSGAILTEPAAKSLGHHAKPHRYQSVIGVELRNNFTIAHVSHNVLFQRVLCRLIGILDFMNFQVFVNWLKMIRVRDIIRPGRLAGDESPSPAYWDMSSSIIEDGYIDGMHELS